jgi:hypothetical protein
MRVTGVIVRFLSMLDVVIVMLGILLLAMAQAQLKTPKKKEGPAGGSNVVQSAVEGRFLYLYAGTEGEERGKCYQLGPDGKRLREVRTENAEDVQQILKQMGGAEDRKNRIVMLVVSDRGFDSMWSPKKLADMEKAWELKIVPLYNVNLDRERKGDRP